MSDQHPASTSTTLIKETKSSSLMPKPVRHLINGVGYLTESFEIGCKGIRDTTKGIDEITSIMLSQQRTRLLAELK